VGHSRGDKYRIHGTVDVYLVDSRIIISSLLYQERRNITVQVLNGLVLKDRLFDGDETMENTDSLRVLIEDGFDILGCLEGILNGQSASDALGG
jgi:hypothetical protein